MSRQKDFQRTSLSSGATETVFVAHITDPDNFCVQLERTADSLDEITTLMQAYYKESSSPNEPLMELALGTPCAAQFHDGEWYRARVTGLLASGMVEVLFVDFGNTEFVSKDSICALRPDLYATAIQGFRCRLAGVSATQDFWSPQHVAQFEDFVLEKSFAATFVAYDPGTDCYSVQLVDKSGANINQKFGEMTGSAVMDTTAGLKTVRSVQAGGGLDLQVTVQQGVGSQAQPKARGIAHALGVSVGDSSPASSIITVPPIVLKTGEKVEVTVVYVITPSEFWCHLKKFGEHNNTMLEEMTAVYGRMAPDEGLLRSLRPGCVCSALFPADKTWYRATVEKVTGRDVTVYFLDYGNTETVPVSNVRELKEEFRSLPAQAVKCSLSGVATASGQWTEEASAEFEEMVMDKAYLATVVGKEASGSHIVSLLDQVDNSDVAQTLMNNLPDVTAAAANAAKHAGKPQAGGASLPSYPTLPVRLNSKCQVFVSWVKTPGDFYVQLSSNQSILDTLTDGLQDFYNSPRALPVTSIQPGAMVVAKFSEDEAWYRGILKNISGHTVEVEFVDFGNSDKVDVDSLKQIDKQFSNIPAQAVHCGLAGVRPLSQGQTWSGDAKDFLERLTENGADCLFISNKDGRYEVELEVGGKSVSKEMISVAVVRGASEPRGSSQPPGDSGDSCGQYRFETLAPGQRNKVYVAFAESVTSFFVQLAARMEALDDLMAQLVTFYDDGGARPLQNPRVGMPCVAQYEEDGTWYRAQVRVVTPQSVDVFFVDYGNTQVAPKDTVYHLEPAFISLPAQAIHCGLDVRVGKNAELLLKQFSDLTGEEELELAVKNQAGSKFVVDLLKNGVSLTSQLQGASPVQSPPGPARPAGSKDYTPANITVGQTVQAFASFIESPSRFWIQIAGTDSVIDAVMKTVGQRYSSGMEPPLANPSPGQACCALYTEDKSWYRASVVSVHGQQIKVRFVDYGNAELVDRENVKPLSPDLLATPLLSIECCLQGYQSVPATDQLIEATEVLLAEKELTVTFMDGKNVQVTVDGQDVGKVLQNKGFGIGGNLTSPKSPAVSAGSARSPLPTSPHGQGFGARSPPSPHGQQAFKEATPPSGSSDAIVTHIEEDTGLFFVQLLSAETQLEQLSSRLQSLFKSGGSPLPGRPAKDTVCAAQFSADGFWYRSRIEHVAGNKVKVRFVDYGNTEIAQSSTLRSLPSEFLAVPLQAFPCELKGLRSWTKQTAAVFCKMVLDVQVKVRFVGSGSPFQVQIMANGQDVLQAVSRSPAASPQKPFGAGSRDTQRGPLPAKGFGAKQDASPRSRGFGSAQQDSWDSGPQQPGFGGSPGKGFGSSPQNPAGVQRQLFGGKSPQKFGSPPQKSVFPPQIYQAQKPPFGKHDVYVSHVCEDGTFYLQLSSDTEKIEGITSKLESLATAVHPAPKVGAACAAQFSEDQAWYRAIIKNMAGGSVEVVFVDFGNGEKCALNSIKPLPADLLTPPTAYCCQLEETGPLAPEQLEAFKAATVDKQLKAAFGPGEPLSVQLSEGDMSLAQVLFPLGSLRSQKIPKESVPAMVSHVGENGLFFVQLNSEENDLLAVVEKIQAAYAGDVEKLEGFEQGQLCCAKFSEDGAWYRARVVTDSGDIVSVLFVDYGNMETVSKDDVLKLLPTFTQPAFAYECRLQGVVRWTASQKKKFVAMTDGKTMNVRFLSQRPPYEVELTRSIGLDLMNVSGSEGAVENTAEQQTAPEETPAGKQVENKAASSGPSPLVTLTEPAGQQAEDFPPQSPPASASCMVAHVDSQGEFFLHLAEDDEKRENLSERLQVECESATAVVPAVGVVCCARFSEDGAWYRAVVEAVEGEMATVRFVDFGNTDQVPFADLRAVCGCADGLSVAPLAYCCVLEGCDGCREDVSSRLEELTADQTLTVTFVSPPSGPPFSVRLQLEDGTSLTTVFTASAGSSTTAPGAGEDGGAGVGGDDINRGATDGATDSTVGERPRRTVSLQAGHRQKVTVSHATSPSLFYVQLEDHSKLDEQAEALFEHYSTLAEGDALVASLSVGQLCAVQYGEDGSWYRALVKDVDPDSDTCTLFYVDYGNMDTVEQSSVRQLLPEFESLPWQCVPCRLAGIRCLGDEWSDDVKAAFEELVAAKSVLADVIAGDGENAPYVVHLLDLGMSVTTSLLAQGLVGIEAVVVEPELTGKRIFSDSTVEESMLSQEEKFEDTMQDALDGGQSLESQERHTVDELEETENEMEFSRQLNQRAAQLESTMLDEPSDGTVTGQLGLGDETSAVMADAAEADKPGEEAKAEEDEEEFQDAVEADVPTASDNNQDESTTQADEDHQAKFSCVGDGLAELEWINVHVCATTSSSNFWCQLPSSKDRLASTDLGCDKAADLEPVQDPQVGHVYLVCDPPHKNYRAKVLSAPSPHSTQAGLTDVHDSSVAVLKVDFGVMDSVATDCLFHLSNEQLSLPAQAFQCCLDDDLPQKHAWFTVLVTQGEVFDSEFQLKVVGRKADGTLLVDLRSASEDASQTATDVTQMEEKEEEEAEEGGRKAVSEVSMDRTLEISHPILQSTVLGETLSQSRMERSEGEKEYSVQLLEVGKEFAATAVAGGNPSAFYVLLEGGEGVLNALADDIAAEVEEKPKDQGSPEAIGVGNACLVRDPATSKWLRGLTKSVTGDAWKVLCVDTGCTVEVSKDCLLDLPSRFLDPPAQAVLCSLADLLPVDGQWCDSALSFFTDFTSQSPLRAYINNYSSDNSVCLVTLFEPQAQGDMTMDRTGNEPSLNRTLVELGYAEAVPGSALDVEMQLERTINDPDKMDQLESSFTEVSHMRENSIGELSEEEGGQEDDVKENGRMNEKGDASEMMSEGATEESGVNEQDAQERTSPSDRIRDTDDSAAGDKVDDVGEDNGYKVSDIDEYADDKGAENKTVVASPQEVSVRKMYASVLKEMIEKMEVEKVRFFGAEEKSECADHKTEENVCDDNLDVVFDKSEERGDENGFSDKGFSEDSTEKCYLFSPSDMFSEDSTEIFDSSIPTEPSTRLSRGPSGDEWVSEEEPEQVGMGDSTGAKGCGEGDEKEVPDHGDIYREKPVMLLDEPVFGKQEDLYPVEKEISEFEVAYPDEEDLEKYEALFVNSAVADSQVVISIEKINDGCEVSWQAREGAGAVTSVKEDNKAHNGEYDGCGTRDGSREEREEATACPAVASRLSCQAGVSSPSQTSSVVRNSAHQLNGRGHGATLHLEVTDVSGNVDVDASYPLAADAPPGYENCEKAVTLDGENTDASFPDGEGQFSTEDLAGGQEMEGRGETESGGTQTTQVIGEEKGGEEDIEKQMENKRLGGVRTEIAEEMFAGKEGTDCDFEVKKNRDENSEIRRDLFDDESFPRTNGHQADDSLDDSLQSQPGDGLRLCAQRACLSPSQFPLPDSPEFSLSASPDTSLDTSQKGTRTFIPDAEVSGVSDTVTPGFISFSPTTPSTLLRKGHSGAEGLEYKPGDDNLEGEKAGLSRHVLGEDLEGDASFNPQTCSAVSKYPDQSLKQVKVILSHIVDNIIQEFTETPASVSQTEGESDDSYSDTPTLIRQSPHSDFSEKDDDSSDEKLVTTVELEAMTAQMEKMDVLETDQPQHDDSEQLMEEIAELIDQYATAIEPLEESDLAEEFFPEDWTQTETTKKDLKDDSSVCITAVSKSQSDLDTAVMHTKKTGDFDSVAAYTHTKESSNLDTAVRSKECSESATVVMHTEDNTTSGEEGTSPKEEPTHSCESATVTHSEDYAPSAEVGTSPFEELTPSCSRQEEVVCPESNPVNQQPSSSERDRIHQQPSSSDITTPDERIEPYLDTPLSQIETHPTGHPPRSPTSHLQAHADFDPQAEIFESEVDTHFETGEIYAEESYAEAVDREGCTSFLETESFRHTSKDLEDQECSFSLSTLESEEQCEEDSSTSSLWSEDKVCIDF